jgi:hypothetical protein
MYSTYEHSGEKDTNFIWEISLYVDITFSFMDTAPKMYTREESTLIASLLSTDSFINQ